MCVLQYIDDTTFGHEEAQTLTKHVRFAICHLQLLGWVIQPKKCIGIDDPLRTVEALGIEINFTTQQFEVGPSRVQQIREICTHVKAQTSVPARTLAATAGVIMSQFAAVGSAARIRTRAMYANLELRKERSADPRDRTSWDHPIPLTPECKGELSWWLQNLQTVNGQPIAHHLRRLRFSGKLFSDASDSGWGGVVLSDDSCDPHESERFYHQISKHCKGSTAAVVTLACNGIEIYGAFTPFQAAQSSTWRELLGALRLIQSLLPILSGGTFAFHLDNQAAVFMLGGVTPLHPDKIFGGSSKPTLQRLVVQILDLAASHNITIRAIWVPRALNIRADAASHFNELDHCDYSLRRRVFSYIDKLWGPHSIDRFASDLNARLPRFNSRFFSEYAEWVDSLTTSWRHENNYVFPPPLLIPLALQRAIDDQAPSTFIVPHWTGFIVPHWTGAFWMHILFPRGQRHPPAKFVTAIAPLGRAADALFSPKARHSHKQSDLPSGDLLAIRLSFDQ